MRSAAYRCSEGEGLAIQLPSGEFRGLSVRDQGYPGGLGALVAAGPEVLRAAAATLGTTPLLDPWTVSFLPPLPAPGKIVCVGLNYIDHSLESGFTLPVHPTIFARFASSLIGHDAPIRRPAASIQLDYEGEVVAVIDAGGRHIPRSHALAHVAGFNNTSVRDFHSKSPQWTVGKNFDTTGAFGPVFVTADELPPGANGPRIRTRLNHRTVHDASIDDMVFDLASLIATLSAAITLSFSPGDAPSGGGIARRRFS